MADAAEVYDNHSTLEVLEHHPSAIYFALHDAELANNAQTSEASRAHPTDEYSTFELSPKPEQSRFPVNEAYNTGEKRVTVDSTDPQKSEHLKRAKEDWKRKRVCGVPLLFLLVGVVVLLTAVAAVVGGVVGSKSRSNNTAPRQQQSPLQPTRVSPGGATVTVSAPAQSSSLIASSTSSPAPSSSATRPTQETWIDGSLNKTYTFKGHYGYYLIDDGQPKNKVSMYEVSTFTDENMRWHIQNVTSAEQASYEATTDWGTSGPTKIYRITPRRNPSGLFLTPDPDIADSITGGAGSKKTRRDIPLKVINRDKDHLPLQAWFFRPQNTSLEVAGGDIPWTIHNVAFGQSWEFDIEHSANWVPMMRRFGDEENDDYRTWRLPLPIG